MAVKTKDRRKEESNGERTYKVIGTRPIRHDGIDKVTGRALYGADVYMQGLLHGKILRSPHAHARINSIDTSAAEALPGVKAVATATDFPIPEDKIAQMGETVVNVRLQSDNFLARTKVLYHGHAVAAVAAINSYIAEEALSLIRVEYDILPHVQDVRQAMRDDAPILLEDLRTDEMGHEMDGLTNVASHIQHKRGDLQEGFKEAAVVIEREFTTSTVHQGYIEPHTSTALYSVDGQLTIWTSTQGAFSVRSEVSSILQMPISNIRVVPMEIGGGFGGKFPAYLDTVAAILSKKSGHRPVKITMSRTEVLQATGPTSGSFIRLKMGADKDGRITAAEAYLAYDAGAYPGSPVGAGAATMLAPYNIPNLLIDGYDVVLNKPKSSAYRAPGATNAGFAAETVIDELSDKLGMDPLEFRLLNGAKEGDRRADGPVYQRIGFLETVEATKAHPHYSAPLAGPNRGRGVASGFWFNGGGRSSASATIEPDGKVSLVEGSTDIGGTRTSVAMQLAETLGIAAEDVKPQVVDTDSVGYTDGTGGSRVTFATGWAAYELGESLKRKLIEQVAELWEVTPKKVIFDDGVFSAKGNRLTFKELAIRLDEEGITISATSAVRPSGVGPAFATHIVDVEVDPETGKVDILRYTAAQDVGTAIHPSYVEGQVQGGVAQGIGWGLNEEYVYDEKGHLVNASFLDYRMPTSLDLPMIDTILVEVPNPGHPYGVRGVGEVPIIPPPAAVANAIYQAIGVRMNVLPMSPANILDALWEKDKKRD